MMTKTIRISDQLQEFIAKKLKPLSGETASDVLERELCLMESKEVSFSIICECCDWEITVKTLLEVQQMGKNHDIQEVWMHKQVKEW